jgi:hypothetical protein
MEETCAHTPDNNKKALLGLFVSLLLLTLVELGFYIFYVIMLPTIWGIIFVILMVLRLIGVSIGLAGNVQQKPNLLLGYFICEILVVVGGVILYVIQVIIVSLTYSTNVGVAILSVLTSIDSTTLIPYLVPTAMTLAYQSRLHLVNFNSETPMACGHTTDNNKISLIAILSVSLVANALIIVLGVLGGVQQVEILYVIIPYALSEVAVLVGLIGAAANIGSKHQSNMYLAFFIMEVIICVITAVLLIVGIIAAATAQAFTIFTVCIPLISLLISYLSGPALVLAWQTRSALSSTVSYIPLGESASGPPAYVATSYVATNYQPSTGYQPAYEGY